MTFITNQKITEALGFDGVVGADGSGDVTTAYVSAADARRIAVFAQTTAGTLTVQFSEAKDDSGTDAQNLGDAVSISDTSGTAEIEAHELSDGFTHVAAVITSSGATPTAGTIVSGERRFS